MDDKPPARSVLDLLREHLAKPTTKYEPLTPEERARIDANIAETKAAETKAAEARGERTWFTIDEARAKLAEYTRQVAAGLTPDLYKERQEQLREKQGKS